MGLTRFLIRRILTGIVVLWIVATGTFFLFFTRPVEVVARELAGRSATPQVINEVIRNLGLNQPILTQYWHFLTSIGRGGWPCGRGTRRRSVRCAGPSRPGCRRRAG